MTKRTFQTIDELAACAGQNVATSDWITITQAQVQQFADATGDHQWIHLDVERAKAGPFGAPIAHGFLTLSLLPKFFASALHVENARMGVNYGLNRVRFMSPVPVGQRVRGHLKLLSSDPIDGGGRQSTWEVTVELEGASKPACVAESVTRVYA